ncbi:MAG: glycoside hydrolase family 3 C-terminal domain-containing protein [Termitinemataceae bacterium]|nr:MAG: glycoside hydrolase family 3 C-terminal domain-containing protein [Termitinemataceae bacterium]
MNKTEIKEKAKSILAQATLEEKARIWSGKNFWETNGIERLELEQIRFSDGPHGLSKHDSAVCYPTASLAACSFDPALIEEMGKALGQECRKAGVDVLLGPGVNHKRSPLCGNFEYYSEDPLLSSAMGEAWVRGVQSVGVGACLKHFAVNSQENDRFFNSSDIDMRTLREIYLLGFERIIAEAAPWSIMVSYNRINEVYSCENPLLLKELGRKTFGFDGAYISDWGAVSGMIESVKASLNLEMPSSHGIAEKRITLDIRAGGNGKPKVWSEGGSTPHLTETELDETISPTIELLLKVKEGKKIPFEFNMEQSLSLAKRIAAESAVLLKNSDDGSANGKRILPLQKTESIAIIGEFAKNPRYQGEGSSSINSVQADNTCDALAALEYNFDYADGYDVLSGAASEAQIMSAIKAAIGKDKVVIFAGLPAKDESEGYDRKDINLPFGQNKLIGEIANINPNVIVVLQTGSPVAMPWLDKVRGVLLMYLAGCRGGAACADLLCGNSVPCGHLSESFPKKIEDTPCYNVYHKDKFNSLYAESIYTGYRYYTTSTIKPLFPFGYGLSYTSFEYSLLTISAPEFQAHGKEMQPITVTVTVTNCGDVAGKTVVQLYVSEKTPTIFKAERELKAFKKIALNVGEKKVCSFKLDGSAFYHFNTALNDFYIEMGDYEIQIGASSEDIKVKAPLTIKNSIPQETDSVLFLPSYYNPKNNNFSIDEYHRLLEVGKKRTFSKPFTADTPLFALGTTFCGRIIQKIVLKACNEYKKKEGNAALDSFMDMPIRFFAMGGITRNTVDAIAEFANGKIFAALRLLFARR